MLMSADNGRINHGIFVVGVFRQRFEDTFPDSGFAPTGEASVNDTKISETFRKVSPWDSGPITE